MSVPIVELELPEGRPIQVATPPALKRAHFTRLRALWSGGRPTQVTKLKGLDLDLVIHGFLCVLDSGVSPVPEVAVTRRGLAALSEAKQALIQRQSPHHELAERLALHLRSKGLWTWTNVEFAAPAGPRCDGTLRPGAELVRPDIFACTPSNLARSASPFCVEVKVTKSDYRADLADPTKRAGYRDIASSLYFACPAGLIAVDELPTGCGLYEELPDGTFRISRRASRTPGFVLSADTAMTLMLKRQEPRDRDD